MFAVLLSSEGDLYSWGYNIYGQLGLKDTSIAATLTPLPLNLPHKIIDVATGFNHALALTESRDVYVWGHRMGVYPQFEFSYHGIKNSQQHQIKDIDCDVPRLLKGNLIYYKIQKVIAGYQNSALITTKGELMIHGMNESGQLGVSQQDLSKNLFFFGEFMKKDYFTTTRGLEVVDCAFGLQNTLVLCKDPANNQTKLFGCGSSDFG